ncbi:hypothetical protein FB567DRAFT_614095 [Paraphoma chrysanthemicola]|uniref:Uncharacterized protein n=1 Tax=Paraphoma chrysanthemicola TaxID=798071 RepID=A0A8K0RBH4_9PLEO|nr:hypothetical protein FB567DRAFT_614095 [Paraphoma chrysanthemicola]
MMSSTSTYDLLFINPLHAISHVELRHLAQALWEWTYCGNCPDNSFCFAQHCAWNERAKRLRNFWSHYQDMTSAYKPDFLSGCPALTSHDDLFALIRLIKQHRDAPRAQLLHDFFEDSGRYHTSNADQRPTSADQNRAFNMAASLLFHVNCMHPHDNANIHTGTDFALFWRDNVSARQFKDIAFPSRSHTYFDSHHGSSHVRSKLAALSAVQLKKRSGLRIRATSDISCHLLLDPVDRSVQVFHWTPILQEVLLETHQDTSNSIMPRQLALELLHTIHKVLFPVNRASGLLIKSLVAKEGFDENFGRYELAPYKRDDDPEITYTYFGSRLADLYDEPQRWESWFVKKSRPSYMLMITMIGVIITVFIGIIGLGLVGVQTWIAWQQWRHPVN